MRKNPTTNENAKPRKIEPLFNDAFVRIFGQNESRSLTRDLVNAMLRRAGIEPIGEITSISAEHALVHGSIDSKTPRLDVRIVVDDRVVDLEAQNYPEDIANRSLFYASEILANSLGRGEGYSSLPQVIVITLLNDSPLFPETSEFVHACKLQWQEGDGTVLKPGPDRVVFVLVELDKIRKRYTSLDKEVLSDEAIAWAYLLTEGFLNEQEVKSMIEEFPTMEQFAERYGFAMDDPDVVKAYDQYTSAEREYESRQRYLARIEREAIERGTEEGKEIGIAEGRKEGRREGRKEERDALVSEFRALGVDESIIEKAIASRKEQLEADE